MENKILFNESQGLRHWWIWMLLILMHGFILFAIYYQVLLGHPLGNKPMSDTGLLVTALLFFGLTLFLVNIRLHTRITQAGIYVRFVPFHRKFRFFGWDEIRNIQIRKYRPIAEYGGWGWRIGITGSGKAYNMYGNKGLQLEFNNGKKLLIGTNKASEMERVFKTDLSHVQVFQQAEAGD